MILANTVFSNRIIDKWNQLPEDVVTCTSVNSFKNRLDRFTHKTGVYISLQKAAFALSNAAKPGYGGPQK